MAQSEIQVTTTPPLPGTQLVQEINDALETIATDFSGSDDPAADAFPYSLWADTATGFLKRRNAANSAWEIIGRIFPSLYEDENGNVDIDGDLDVTGDLSADNISITGSLSVSGGNISPQTGLKNRIINGGMTIDQRNAGAAVTALDSYAVDRWQYEGSQTSKVNLQQNAGGVTPPAGFTNYYGVTSSSAYSVLSGDFFFIGQRIEGFNIADLGWGTANATTVTLSFWVRSSLTGTFGGALVNSASNRTYIFAYSIVSANTWEQKSITILGETTGTWVTNNGIGIRIRFSLGTGSVLSGTAGAWESGNYISATGATSVVGTNGATFYITGVQLEKGSVATPFEFRSIGQELALCQRYYEKSYNQSVVPGTASVGAGAAGFATSTSNGYNYGVVRFAVSKRAASTVTTYSYAGTAGVASDGNASDLTANSAGVNLPGETGYNLNNGSGGTLTFTGNSYFVNWVASAEL
jgi:hypothetical protein